MQLLNRLQDLIILVNIKKIFKRQHKSSFPWRRHVLRFPQESHSHRSAQEGQSHRSRPGMRWGSQPWPRQAKPFPSAVTLMKTRLLGSWSQRVGWEQAYWDQNVSQTLHISPPDTPPYPNSPPFFLLETKAGTAHKYGKQPPVSSASLSDHGDRSQEASIWDNHQGNKEFPNNNFAIHYMFFFQWLFLIKHVKYQ